jgi:hypothetical protein
VNVREILSRLVPEKFRRRPVIAPEERLKLFATVSDNDNCLRAVTDQMQELLEGEFMTAINPERTDAQRLRACDGMRVAFWSLHNLEAERQAANRQRAEREQQRQPAAG